MFVYKIDVLQQLKQMGYTTTKIRNEKIIGEASLQSLRQGKPVGIKTLDVLCTLLSCQPGDIIEHVPTDKQ